MKYLLVVLLLIPAIAVAQIIDPSPYCHWPNTSDMYGGAIINVSISTLNNSTPSDTSNTTYFSRYKYFNNIPAPILYTDSTYILSITFDSIYNTGAYAGTTDDSWYVIAIPFDTLSIDGAYQFNGSVPRYYKTGVVGADFTPITDTFHVTIPHSAYLCKTRLRVSRYGHGTGLPHVCMDATDNGNEGETEDYDLDIRNAPPIDTTTFISTLTKQYTKFYPNPTNGILHIASSSEAIIYNTLGQIVENANGKSEINISNLPNGLYYIKQDNIAYPIQKY